MKKLITILSVSSIVASSGALSVACASKEKIVESDFLNSKANLAGAFKYRAANLIATDQYHINSKTMNDGFQDWNATGYSSIDGFDDKDKGIKSISLSEIVNDYLGNAISVDKTTGNVDLNGTYGTGTGNFIDQGIMNLIVDVLKKMIGDPNDKETNGLIEAIMPMDSLTSFGLVDKSMSNLMTKQVKTTILDSLDQLKNFDISKIFGLFSTLGSLASQTNVDTSVTSNNVIGDDDDHDNDRLMEDWPDGASDSIWDTPIKISFVTTTLGEQINLLLPDLDSDWYLQNYGDLQKYSQLTLFNYINSMIGTKNFIALSSTDGSNFAEWSKSQKSFDRLYDKATPIGQLLGLNILKESNLLDLTDNQIKDEIDNITIHQDHVAYKPKIIDIDGILKLVKSLAPDLDIETITKTIEEITPYLAPVKILFSLLNMIKYSDQFSELINDKPNEVWSSEEIKSVTDKQTINDPTKDFYYSFHSILNVITTKDLTDATAETPNYDGLIEKMLKPILNDVVKFIPNLAYLILNKDDKSETIRLQNLFNTFNVDQWTSKDDSYAFDRLGIYDESIYSDFKIKTPVTVQILTSLVGEVAKLLPNLNVLPDSIKDIIVNTVIPGVATDKLPDIIPATLKSIVTNVLYCVTNNKTFKVAEGQRTGTTVVQENDGLILKLKDGELPDADNKNVQSLLNSALVLIANDDQINPILNAPLSYIAKILTDLFGKALKPLFDLKEILFETPLKDIFDNKNDPFFDGIGSKYVYDEKYGNMTLIEYLTDGYVDGKTDLLPFILDKAMDVLSDLNTQTNPLNINEGYENVAKSINISDSVSTNFKGTNIINSVIYKVHFEMNDTVFYTKNLNEIALHSTKRSADYDFIISRKTKYSNFKIDLMKKTKA